MFHPVDPFDKSLGAVAGNLFFQDYTQYSDRERMRAWDRSFSTLRSFPNVIITPHSAFLTAEALQNIAETTIENLKQFVLGKELTNAVKLQ